MPASFLYLQVFFFSIFFSLITCCVWSSFKDSVQIQVSTLKVIFLCLAVAPLMVFWRSSLGIAFRNGKFNSFACANKFVPELDHKHLFFYTPVHTSFYNWKCPSCCFVGWLHQCIFTLQHIPEDGSFYFVYRVNLYYCFCVALHFTWEILIIKVHLDGSFHDFSFYPFWGYAVRFSNSCDSISFYI